MRIETFIQPIVFERAILGFTGWPDAGKVVQHTFAEIKKAFPYDRVAVWNLEGFWHTTSSRPLVFVRGGQIRRLDWPEYHFFLVRLPSSEDILLGLGPEPTTNWKEFSQELMELLKNWGCKELYTIGSLYDQILYDEVLISGLVYNIRGINQLKDMGLDEIEYAGPAAVQSALLEAAKESALHGMGLWVHYPSYLSSPHELLTAHLLHKLGALLDVQFDTTILMERWQKRALEIENRIEHDHDLQEGLDVLRQEMLPEASSPPVGGKLLSMSDYMEKHRKKPRESQ